MWAQSLDWEDLLEEEMATHSSILAWEIPWTEELGGLQSVGSQSFAVGDGTYYIARPHRDENGCAGYIGRYRYDGVTPFAEE